VYEPIVRKLAGFGRAPTGPDPDRYDTRHAHCDVLVIGAGTAGIEVARTAGSAGQRVMLAEQDPFLDGAVLSLASVANVQVLRRTTAVACYDHDLVALTEEVFGGGAQAPRERLWLVRAGRVVLATGALE
jgi:sarcosine oxidase, subunit alpha